MFSKAAIEACNELLARMNEHSDPSEAWFVRVTKAANNEVDLTARYT